MMMEIRDKSGKCYVFSTQREAIAIYCDIVQNEWQNANIELGHSDSLLVELLIIRISDALQALTHCLPLLEMDISLGEVSKIKEIMQSFVVSRYEEPLDRERRIVSASYKLKKLVTGQQDNDS